MNRDDYIDLVTNKIRTHLKTNGEVPVMMLTMASDEDGNVDSMIIGIWKEASIEKDDLLNILQTASLFLDRAASFDSGGPKV